MWPSAGVPKEDAAASGKRFRRTTSMNQIKQGPKQAPRVGGEAQHTKVTCDANNGATDLQDQQQQQVYNFLQQKLDGQWMPPADGYGKGLVIPAQPKLWPVSEGSERLMMASRPVDFLDACFFCRRRLRHERDIFIYRGDTAFCSEDCRTRQIATDEYKPPRKGSANSTTETALAA